MTPGGCLLPSYSSMSQRQSWRYHFLLNCLNAGPHQMRYLKVYRSEWRLTLADFNELSTFLYPIGLYNTRAKRLIDFSTMWLSHPPRQDILMKRKSLPKYPPTAISHLPGVVLCWRGLMI